MTDTCAARVSCRQIGTADLDAVIDLLQVGFPTRSKAYWQAGLQRLAAVPPPDGMPRFGYLLASEGAVVGVLLLISSDGGGTSTHGIRCNVSSWYVRPDFRAYASFLTSRALKGKSVTYIDVWPADHTRQTIEAQGFTRAAKALFAGLPALSVAGHGAKLTSTPEQWSRSSGMSPWELRLLTDHQRFGCICVWYETNAGGQPFIFRRRKVARGLVPCALLIYARSVESFEEAAGPLGRFLALRGLPIVLIGADRPLRGMIGKHFPERLPIYSKGPQKMRGSDLSYTDAALFGI